MLKLLDFNDRSMGWKTISNKGRVGIIILNISLLGPFYMALSLIYRQNLTTNIEGQVDLWPVYFSLIGPIQLLISAALLEIVVNFFIIKGNKAAWWAALIGSFWIGLNDSIASTVFWSKFPKISTPPLAPFVTAGVLLGLYLTNEFIFKHRPRLGQK